MIKRKIDVEVEPDAFELAREFCEMDADVQATFFDFVAYISKEWDNSFCRQVDRIVTSEWITNEALSIMKTLGEYATLSQKELI